MFRRLGLIVCCLLAILMPATATAATTTPVRSWVAAGSNALDHWYVPLTGVYGTTGWWNAANALQAQLVASNLLGDDRGVQHAASTYDANIGTSFRNDFYDDEGWWGLTWLQAYDLTHEHRYLVLAESLFTDIAGGWDLRCGGGVWWSKSRTYKNAIPNELFVALAAKLALRTDGPAAANYRNWAQIGWSWFQDSGMINDHGLVNDGLDDRCANNGRTTWTYNQGVILGGLADLYRLTGDNSYLRAATRLAMSATAALGDVNDVLHEPCEPHCDIDQTQFKGIFMRNLVALNEVDPSPRYAEFALRNAQAIWHAGRNGGDQFGLKWNGPVDAVDASRQSSALDCLNSALRLAHSD